MIEIITPTSREHWLELRAQDITSTEISALYGVSPYQTAFELGHRKLNKEIVSIEANERMKWGTRLQDAIAAGVAEDQGWSVRKMDEYIRNPLLRIGSSFDFGIGEDGLLEIKNVDGLAFRDGWTADEDTGELEAPLHIELQVQHQLAVSGRKFAFICALVGGNKIHLIQRDRNESVIEDIKIKAAEFWKGIDVGVVPAPDFTRDADTIAKIYNQAEKGKFIDARRDIDLALLVQEYKKFAAEEKSAKESKDAMKAQILMKVGDAEKVIGEGYSVTLGTVAGGHVSYERSAYRMFKINVSKTKGE